MTNLLPNTNIEYRNAKQARMLKILIPECFEIRLFEFLDLFRISSRIKFRIEFRYFQLLVILALVFEITFRTTSSCCHQTTAYKANRVSTKNTLEARFHPPFLDGNFCQARIQTASNPG